MTLWQSQFVPTQPPVLHHTLTSQALDGRSGLHRGHHPALGWGNMGQAALTAPRHSPIPARRPGSASLITPRVPQTHLGDRRCHHTPCLALPPALLSPPQEATQEIPDPLPSLLTSGVLYPTPNKVAKLCFANRKQKSYCISLVITAADKFGCYFCGF